jgi:hypothetical protein
MKIILREVLKLQNLFLKLYSSKQWNTETIIKAIKSQLETNLGALMSKEISEMLVDMIDFFNESFSLLKSYLDEKENTVKAVK